MSSVVSVEIYDDAPNVQCYDPPLSLDISSPRDFSIDNIRSQVIHDPDLYEVARIEASCDRGIEIVRMVYTFRSLSRAIPDINLVAASEIESSDPDRIAKIEEINSTIVEMLHAEVMKIRDLMVYISTTIDIICETVALIARLLSSEINVACTSFVGKYSSIIRLLDILFKLDSMKDMRGSMKSDFSRYKRACKSNSGVLEEVTEIQQFLSNQDPHKTNNYVLLTIRDRLKLIRGYERVLNDILDLVLSNFENGVYVTPDEKFGLLRLVPHLMVLLDGDASDPKSVNVFKRANASTIQKLMKRYPIVPLYADMSITLLYILERAQHYNRVVLGESWGSDASSSNGGRSCDMDSNPDYDLKVHWGTIRSKYSRYIVTFTAFLNRLSRSKHDTIPKDLSSTSPVGKSVLESAETAHTLALKGMFLLSQWKARVDLTMAWKYTHPATPKISAVTAVVEGTEMGKEYQQVVQNNFTEDELSALVDIVTMIKSLSSALSKAHAQLAPLFRIHQHHRIQKVTRSDMLPLLHRVDKHKVTLLAPLLQVVNLVADYGTNIGKEGDEDYKTYSRKHGAVNTTHDLRVVAAGASRLYLLRSKIHGIYDDRSVYRQKAGLFGKGSNLEKDDIVLLEAFYSESFFFPYMLDFNSTLREVSSMADLWYREFHLELTKCVQFPIEMSLPWMLIERSITPHVVSNDTRNTHIPMVENLFFLLDIYNDAAHQALHVLHRQHLFDEIEAEANLVLEQTLMAVSEDMYVYFKNFSASSLLEILAKLKLEEINGSRFLTIGTQRYDNVMCQRRVNLLGRSINFSAPFILLVVRRIHRDVDTAIRRFEAGDACHVVELKMLLDIIRHTHSEIAQLFEIEDYAFIFGDANESLLDRQEGRIMKHLLSSLDSDIVSNHSYNTHTSRFIRSLETPSKSSSTIDSRPSKPKAPPVKAGAVTNAYGSLCCKAYETFGKATKGYFGRAHIDAVLSLTGCTALRSGVFLIAERYLNSLTDKLLDAHDYMGVLRNSIPHCELPSFNQHVGGCVEYFTLNLGSLLEFDDLKPELFQAFREIGNIVLLLRDVSDALCASFPLAAMSTDSGTRKSPMDHLLDNLAYPTLARAASSLPKEGDRSLYRHTLQHVELVLRDFSLFEGWTESPSDHIEASTVDRDDNRFHIMWSSVCFLSCLAPPTEPSDAERFGDGFIFSGCLILHFLHQRELFELNDYNYHVLRVHSHDCRASAFCQISSFRNETSSMVRSYTNTESFIAAAAECFNIQQTVFDALSAQWKSIDINVDGEDEAGSEKVTLFRAPAQEN